jgi:hypothetical protein
MISTSVGYFGQWRMVFTGIRLSPTRLQRTELWLTDAISRVLRERGVGKQAKNHTTSGILSSKGMLIPDCEHHPSGYYDLTMTPMVMQARSAGWTREGPFLTNPVSVNHPEVTPKVLT